jgi:hypothetical protein
MDSMPALFREWDPAFIDPQKFKDNVLALGIWLTMSACRPSPRVENGPNGLRLRS